MLLACIEIDCRSANCLRLYCLLFIALGTSCHFATHCNCLRFCFWESPALLLLAAACNALRTSARPMFFFLSSPFCVTLLHQ